MLASLLLSCPSFFRHVCSIKNIYILLTAVLVFLFSATPLYAPSKERFASNNITFAGQCPTSFDKTIIFSRPPMTENCRRKCAPSLQRVPQNFIFCANFAESLSTSCLFSPYPHSRFRQRSMSTSLSGSWSPKSPVPKRRGFLARLSSRSDVTSMDDRRPRGE